MTRNHINNIAWGGSETLNFYNKYILFFLHKISMKKANKIFFQNNDDIILYKNEKRTGEDGNGR